MFGNNGNGRSGGGMARAQPNIEKARSRASNWQPDKPFGGGREPRGNFSDRFGVGSPWHDRSREDRPWGRDNVEGGESDRMSIFSPEQDGQWGDYADQWSDMWANRGQQEQAPEQAPEQAQPQFGWQQKLAQMNAEPWDSEAMREQMLNRMQAFRGRYGNQG